MQKASTHPSLWASPFSSSCITPNNTFMVSWLELIKFSIIWSCAFKSTTSVWGTICWHSSLTATAVWQGWFSSIGETFIWRVCSLHSVAWHCARDEQDRASPAWGWTPFRCTVLFLSSSAVGHGDQSVSAARFGRSGCEAFEPTAGK